MKLLETRHQIKSGLLFLPYNNNSVLLLLLPLHRAFQLAFLLIPLLVVESPPLLDHKTLGWSGKDKKTYSAQRYTILTCIAFVRVNLVSEALFGDTAPQPNPPHLHPQRGGVDDLATSSKTQSHSFTNQFRLTYNWPLEDV